MEHQFRYLEVGIRLHSTEIAKRILHIKGQITETRRRLVGEGHTKEPSGCGGESDGVLLSSVVGNIDQLAKGLAVVAGLNIRDGRSRSEHIGCGGARIVQDQGHSVHGLRRREFVLNPCLLARGRLGQLGRLHQIGVGQQGQVKSTAAGSNFWLK